jgi:hypothetical protein
VYSTLNSEKYIWYKLKTEKAPFLAYVRGEIKIMDTQNKTAKAIVVKIKIDMVIGGQVWFKSSNQQG